MKPQYTCPECGTGFNDQTAYCEDWRDKDKKFGCPGCRIFFCVGYSSIENKNKPVLATLIAAALSATILYASDAALMSYIHVPIVGYLGYFFVGRISEGNPRLVLTPIAVSQNNT